MSDGDKIILAAEHVRKGRIILARQRRLIAKIRAHGGDARQPEDLLATFEKTLVIFEEDFQRLIGGKR